MNGPFLQKSIVFFSVSYDLGPLLYILLLHCYKNKYCIDQEKRHEKKCMAHTENIYLCHQEKNNLRHIMINQVFTHMHTFVSDVCIEIKYAAISYIHHDLFITL